MREAHPADGWRVRQNDRQGIIVNEPKTSKEREAIAETCSKELKISIPIIIDGMDDAVEKAYSGWPDRIYVIDKSGKVAYRGAPGPAGFKPQEAETALKKLLSSP